MRNAVKTPVQGAKDHTGLAYEVLAPLDITRGTFKIPDDDRRRWLEDFTKAVVPEGYTTGCERWKHSFAEDPTAHWATLETTSRLLIGHGNAAPTEVGLTLHHTWGTPVIPGSALKGLCAHYVETHWGHLDDWKGVSWVASRIASAPGRHYRDLFGAPEADDEDSLSMAQGCVVFHDALWVPSGTEKLPLAVDVLTPHQSEYYRNSGAAWPNDYDSPIPVSFLTVKPGTSFWLVLSGDQAAAALARNILVDALAEWGVGAKTVAGYGRIAAGSFGRGRAAADGWTGAFLAAIKDVSGNTARMRYAQGKMQDLVVRPAEQRQVLAKHLQDAISSDSRTKAFLADMELALADGIWPRPVPAPVSLPATLVAFWGAEASAEAWGAVEDAVLDGWESWGEEARAAAVQLVETVFGAADYDKKRADLWGAVADT